MFIYFEQIYRPSGYSFFGQPELLVGIPGPASFKGEECSPPYCVDFQFVYASAGFFKIFYQKLELPASKVGLKRSRVDRITGKDIHYGMGRGIKPVQPCCGEKVLYGAGVEVCLHCLCNLVEL